MKIVVINGANLNMLGIREPGIYGSESYADLCKKIEEHAEKIGVEVNIFQSNHEGALVDRIQEAYFEGAGGIVINPGAYTHTSIALRDALAAVGIPAVEVHISNVDEREDFRKISYIRNICKMIVIGHGTNGYLEAMDFLLEEFGK